MRNCFMLFCCALLLLAVSCSEDEVSTAPNLDLETLTTSWGTLAPAFDPTVKAYTVTVGNAYGAIVVYGTAADTNAIVSYDPGQTNLLSVGSNLITVRVTSADLRVTNSYRVVVYRISTDANLASLSVSGGVLTPALTAGVTEYSLISYLPNSVGSVQITASAAYGEAVVTWLNGQQPALTVGSNRFAVRVTAEDGTTTKDYHIRVYRMGADYLSPAIGPLKYVPAGSFRRDGIAANISFVSAVRMSSNEITRSQYSNVMGVDPADTNYSSGTSDPVQRVNWNQAITFCNKLSIAEGLKPVYSVIGVDFTNLAYVDIPTVDNAAWEAATANWAASGYRLPTEMEWMWAAMGAQVGGDPFVVNTTGYNKAFAGSTGSNSIGDYALYGIYNGGSATTATTTTVGGRLANELGLADMSGNIWEWCWDWHDSYPSGYQEDYWPAVSGTFRIVRGGCWGSNADDCKIDYRQSNYPANRYYLVGFRVVRP